MLETTATVQREPLERKARPAQAPGAPSAVRADKHFWIAVASALALGAGVRISYLVHAAPVLVLGDGFAYYVEASRIADGLGYTSGFGDVGAELAHHPPGWVTLLAGVAEFGWRDMRAHQVTGVVIGLGLIVVTALVGRR
ncbi:MAG: hypothetical protein ACRD0V_20570, partial [Acidimicrobiales bacterium]